MRVFLFGILGLAGFAAELTVIDAEKTCTPDELTNGKCIIRLSAKGATYLRVKAKAVDGPAASALTSNEIAVPDVGTAALTVKLPAGILTGPGPHIINLAIESSLGATAQPVRPAKLIIPGEATAWKVFDGKPVAILLTRKWGRDAEGRIEFILRGTPKSAKPVFANAEFYRTVNDEFYSLNGKLLETSILENKAPVFPFKATVQLPRGNYTSAGGTIYFQTEGGEMTPVPVLYRLRDDWLIPVAALLAGHILLLFVRRWVQVERPANLLLVRILGIDEAVRAHEAANSGSAATLAPIKANLASARRALEELDLAGA